MQGIYDIIIASDEKSEVFGDEAAEGEGEKKEAKKPKVKEGEDGAEQPRKKRKNKKDEEYGVSRGMPSRPLLKSAADWAQESTSRMSLRWSTSTCPHPLHRTPTG